jgi:hypothetical protein
MSSFATISAPVRTLIRPQQQVVRRGIISSCTLQHNQIFFERPFQLIRYQLFYHTMPQNVRNWKRCRLNYKQKSTLAHSVNKLRCSPANVLFLIHNLLWGRTSTLVLPSHNLLSHRISTLILPSAGVFTKQTPAAQTLLQSGLIRFVSWHSVRLLSLSK